MENAEWLERVKRVNQFLLEYTEEGEGFSVGYITLKRHYRSWGKSIGLPCRWSELFHVLVERFLLRYEPSTTVIGLRMKHPVGLPRYYNRKRISNGVKEAVYAKLRSNGNMCALCGRPILADDKVHIDHILPVYRGGTDDSSNLQVVHAKCNYSKWFGQEVEHSAEWHARRQKAMDEVNAKFAEDE